MRTILLLTFLTSFAQAGTVMNYQGSCTGALKNGSVISLKYYSDFDGCMKVSQAAVSFDSGLPFDLLTGARSFTHQDDIYSFKASINGRSLNLLELKFKNSTGNTSGVMNYLDEESKSREFINLKCSVRDYEYQSCLNVGQSE
jgi:hypothetical protein